VDFMSSSALKSSGLKRISPSLFESHLYTPPVYPGTLLPPKRRSILYRSALSVRRPYPNESYYHPRLHAFSENPSQYMWLNGPRSYGPPRLCRALTSEHRLLIDTFPSHMLQELSQEPASAAHLRCFGFGSVEPGGFSAVCFNYGDSVESGTKSKPVR